MSAGQVSDIPTGLMFEPAPTAPSTFNVLLFGKPKSGKSTAAATAPGPILWLNAEGPGALGYARKTAADRGTRILEVALNAHTPNPAGVLNEVYRHVREGRDPKVETVVIDTLAKVREALIGQLVQKGSKNSLPQYGQVADKLGGFINSMRDLPVNLVLLAHVDSKESEGEGRIVDPLIGGKLTETVPGEVDVVAYTSMLPDEDGTRRYYGQLVEGKGRTAGDRSGALAGERGFRELNLTEWLAVYRAALTPDESDLPWEPPKGDALPAPVDVDPSVEDAEPPQGALLDDQAVASV